MKEGNKKHYSKGDKMELKELKKRNRVVITGKKVREFFELDKVTEERKQGICEFCDKEGDIWFIVGDTGVGLCDKHLIHEYGKENIYPEGV